MSDPKTVVFLAEQLPISRKTLYKKSKKRAWYKKLVEFSVNCNRLNAIQEEIEAKKRELTCSGN